MSGPRLEDPAPRLTHQNTEEASADQRGLEDEETRFVFGGVAFDIHPSPGLVWRIGDEHRLFQGAYSEGPIIAHVHCAANAALHLSGDSGREIRTRTDGANIRVETGRVRSTLRKLGPGRYAATAFVNPGEFGCASLCTALAAVIAQREGGLILHAAAIELDHKAYLFIGPSGAGKTTAAHHCSGAQWLARDRALVFPSPSGWQVAGLAGGDVIRIPQTDRRILPLGGVFRIRREASSPKIEPLGLSAAVGVLRESLQTTVHLSDQERALDAALSVAADNWVANLHTVLSGELCALIRSFR